MSQPLRLHLFRHGETAWSLTGQHTGSTDIPLTVHGEAMARGLGRSLQDTVFAQVLTSPRLRARRTCALAGLGGAAQVDDDLAEWNYGDHEGLSTAQIQEMRPGWDVWTDGCPGGETPDEVSARADRLIGRLAAQSGNIALFTHGQFGRVLAARWIGLAAHQGQHFRMDPASIGILGIDAAHAPRRVIAQWNAMPTVGASPPVSAAALRAAIEAALARQAIADAEQITIEEHGCDVSLSGTVRDGTERAAVARAAWASPGVCNVVDMMTLAR